MSEAHAETRSHRPEDLQAAVEDPHWDFRTVDGIAQDLGLPPSEVAEMLVDHAEIVRRSILTDRQGEPLYTARGRRPTVRERIERFRSVL